MLCCCGARPSRKVIHYEGALSWSAIVGETDQSTVLTFVSTYSELHRAQLQKAASGNSRAASKSRNDLRVLCGRPPIAVPSLARIRNSLPKADVAAFDALGIDSTMLAHEFVLMLQKFPEHFDDAKFLCEQLFRKVSVEDLVESAEEKQRRRSSNESRNQKASRKSSATHIKPQSNSAGHDNRQGETNNWVEGSDFAVQQSRRGSSGSSRAGSAGSASRRRDSTSSTGSRRSGSSRLKHRAPTSSINGVDVRALPDPNWAPVQTEPHTPRRGSVQSIEEFEREMDTYLEQKRWNGKESELNESQPSSGAVDPAQPEKVAYFGAASKGGSFLPALPDFDSNHQRRRSSGPSSSRSQSLGSGQRERTEVRPHSSSSADGSQYGGHHRKRRSRQRADGAHDGHGGDGDCADGSRRRRSDVGVARRRHSRCSGASCGNDRRESGGHRRRSADSTGTAGSSAD